MRKRKKIGTKKLGKKKDFIKNTFLSENGGSGST
jgi:hypothetical protein